MNLVPCCTILVLLVQVVGEVTVLGVVLVQGHLEYWFTMIVLQKLQVRNEFQNVSCFYLYWTGRRRDTVFEKPRWKDIVSRRRRPPWHLFQHPWTLYSYRTIHTLNEAQGVLDVHCAVYICTILDNTHYSILNTQAPSILNNTPPLCKYSMLTTCQNSGL